MLFCLAAVLQMVESFDLIQGVQKTPGEQVDPQHAGWVHTELQAVQLGIQVRGGHWKRKKSEKNNGNKVQFVRKCCQLANTHA